MSFNIFQKLGKLDPLNTEGCFKAFHGFDYLDTTTPYQ